MPAWCIPTQSSISRRLLKPQPQCRMLNAEFRNSAFSSAFCIVQSALQVANALFSNLLTRRGARDCQVFRGNPVCKRRPGA